MRHAHAADIVTRLHSCGEVALCIFYRRELLLRYINDNKLRTLLSMHREMKRGNE